MSQKCEISHSHISLLPTVMFRALKPNKWCICFVILGIKCESYIFLVSLEKHFRASNFQISTKNNQIYDDCLKLGPGTCQFLDHEYRHTWYKQSELLGQFRLIGDRASDVSGGRICLTQNAYAEI